MKLIVGKVYYAKRNVKGEDKLICFIFRCKNETGPDQGECFREHSHYYSESVSFTNDFPNSVWEIREATDLEVGILLRSRTTITQETYSIWN